MASVAMSVLLVSTIKLTDRRRSGKRRLAGYRKRLLGADNFL